jgi:hypothetical protein
VDMAEEPAKACLEDSGEWGGFSMFDGVSSDLVLTGSTGVAIAVYRSILKLSAFGSFHRD